MKGKGQRRRAQRGGLPTRRAVLNREILLAEDVAFRHAEIGKKPLQRDAAFQPDMLADVGLAEVRRGERKNPSAQK